MQIYRYESALEEKMILVHVAMPSVREIREQRKIMVKKDGRMRPNWVDLQMRWDTGMITANYIKYLEDVDQEMEDSVERACDQVGDRFAHEYRILAESDITMIQIENARDVIECAKDFDLEAEERVKSALRRLPERFRPDEVASATGLGQRAVRAGTALVGKGFTSIPKNVRLDGGTLLFNLVAFDGPR
ncbi:hypothetical protein [Mesorhizobium sp.]|uniref:hypothetical protein n=1 Tax=Mesorhizobium sp. TaxID=1871066 RepID=UPI001213BCA5|nr:hypothetical protein [Mesorhizobium sp.]TIS87699.1 MAG: hypothetical protein E5W89_24000 [Mesorhizobium sp.]